MIYLDSAATSLLKPPSVARAASMAIRTMASPGRGRHGLCLSGGGRGALSRPGAGARCVYHECDARARYCHSLASFAR